MNGISKFLNRLFIVGGIALIVVGVVVGLNRMGIIWWRHIAIGGMALALGVYIYVDERRKRG